MARADYMPANDGQYLEWLQHFLDGLAMHAADFGLLPADITPLDDARDNFSTRLSNYTGQKNLAHTACAGKDAGRTTSEEILRPLVRRINNHPAMTDEMRVFLGLKREDVVPAGMPLEEQIPSLFLEAIPNQVTVHWGPNPRKENNNGKPAGVRGAVIYRKKTGEADFQIMGYTTSSPYYDAITGGGSDYTYIVRYRGTKQTDLSAPSSAETIAARGDLAA